MEYGVKPRIPLRIVVDQSKATNAVEIEILETEPMVIVERAAVAGLVGDGCLS